MATTTFSTPILGTSPNSIDVAAFDAAINAMLDELHDVLGAIVTGLNPRGAWAASGSFPSGAAAGDFWLVSTAGSVDAQTFAVGDWLVALVANASTTTFAGNWTRGDYSKVVRVIYEEVTALLASLETARGTGALWQARGGLEWAEADAAATDHHVTTAGGVKLYVVPGPTGWPARAFGARGDGTTDDTAAIQKGLNAIAADSFAGRRGGALVFGDGLYRVAGTLVPASENISLIGSGRRNFQRGAFEDPGLETQTAVPATLYKTGIGALIELRTEYKINGFQIRDITLLGAAADVGNTMGVRFLDNSTAFRRDFQFVNVAFHRFTPVFQHDVDATTRVGALGPTLIERCQMTHNRGLWHRAAGAYTQVNGFRFLHNEAGGNHQDTTRGNLELFGQAIQVRGNVLEGQANPIIMDGASRGYIIDGNYFESNTGKAAIQLIGCGRGSVGPNYYYLMDTEYTALADHSLGVVSFDPVTHVASVLPTIADMRTRNETEEGNYRVPTGRAIPFSYIQRASEARRSKRQALTYSGTTFPGSFLTREEWIDGEVIASAEVAVGAGGLLAYEFTGLSAGIGAWTVVTIPCKYMGAPTGLNTSMLINGSGSDTDGSWASTWSSATALPEGEWVLLVLAARARVALTSLLTYWYPFGTGTGSVRYLNPSLYITSVPEKIEPAVDIRRHQRLAAAPTVGSWLRGDVIYDESPTAADFIGWVCTADGTPGTWKTFGPISG